MFVVLMQFMTTECVNLMFDYINRLILLAARTSKWGNAIGLCAICIMLVMKCS